MRLLINKINFRTASFNNAVIRHRSVVSWCVNSNGNIRYFSSSSSSRLFNTILIANRGEIACRVIKSCKKLGIKTVAIYSEPDVNSVHVEMADHAVCVGPAQSSQSYLNINKIIDVCKQTGAEAVHPGYGFLSENRLFQEQLQANNIKFIGPGTHAISAMGDKISSKKIARDAKVNTIPGYLGVVNNEQDVIRVSNEIGYPVMIKASAGGGGKGMRIAWNDDEAKSGYHLSKQEAKSSFGDDTMFIEKFIEEPRHIEIQILADSFGEVVYLHERECTVQRRNQKVIEEAPSVFLDPQTRKAMGEQAVMLAKAVKYESAGTCEFLVDKHRQFYFLEMNTRLQVEHPVTESITGIDLVEQMIRVAAGHPLPFKQNDIPLQGWAFESRVYAEDPLRGFLPSIGHLKRYVEPSGSNIRVDSGVREGSEISIHYDPMISKLITFGSTRDEALSHMRAALDSYVIRGVTHNVNFLRSLCDHPRFIEGRLTTNFIPEEYPKGYNGAVLSNEQIDALIASSLIIKTRGLINQLTINNQLQSFNNKQFISNQLKETFIQFGKDKQLFKVEIESTKYDHQICQLTLLIGNGVQNSNKRKLTINSQYQRGDYVFNVEINNTIYTLQVINVNDGSAQLHLQYAGTSFPIYIYSPKQYSLLHYMPVPKIIDTSKLIISPMPGAVFSVKVQVGDNVVPGQEVCVVEAMKMQNALRAVNAAKVKKINVKPGQTVSADQVLIEFE